MRELEYQGKPVCPGGIAKAEGFLCGKKRAEKVRRVRNLACLFLPVVSFAISFTFRDNAPVVWLASITIVAILSWYAAVLEIVELKDTDESLPGRLAKADVQQQGVTCNNTLLINEISRVLRRATSNDDMLVKVCAVLGNRLDFDHGLIMTANSLTARLEHKASYGYSNDQLEGLKGFGFQGDGRAGEELFVDSFRQMRTISMSASERIEKEPAPQSKVFLREMGIASIICCPIFYKDEAIGILAVSKNRPGGAILQRDVDVLQGIASQIAARIHNIRLEEQLRQAQKMEVVGMLAGGLAHDFGNILTTIIGNSELISYQLPDNHPMKERIADIREAGEKAAGLTDQLVTFCRKQAMELKVIDLNTIIKNITRLLGRMIGENIELKSLSANPFVKIKADVGQIEQILMNMAVNARDAMPNGGVLSIETAEVEVDEQFGLTICGIEPGRYAALTITDSGVGMSREVQQNIFEPFFTTKEHGKGTGLGLATVFGIVKQLNGYIDVHSELEKGTTFKIFFPLIIEEAVPEKIVFDEKDMPSGKEAILVVDDDISIRKLVVSTLEPLGYKLIEAEGGLAAIDLLMEPESRIDLILSDMVMPGVSGRELIAQIKKEKPNIKAVLMSGYTDDIVDPQGFSETDSHFISKPIRPIMLAKKIRSALDGVPVN